MKKFGKFQKRPAAKQMLIQTYITSLICLMLCVTMFFGTTAAWFTSSVTTPHNQIMVGTLKVELNHASFSNGTLGAYNEVNETYSILKDSIKWEPNYTAVEKFELVEKGDLAFAYQMTIGFNFASHGDEATDENNAKYAAQEAVTKAITVWTYTGDDTDTLPVDFKNLVETGKWTKVGTLFDVINGKLPVFQGSMNSETVKSVNEDAKVTHMIALHMDENFTGLLGDENNPVSIQGTKLEDISIELVATQMFSEKDAFGSAYDDQKVEMTVVKELTKDDLDANNALKEVTKLDATDPGSTVPEASVSVPAGTKLAEGANSLTFSVKQAEAKHANTQVDTGMTVLPLNIEVGGLASNTASGEPFTVVLNMPAGLTNVTVYHTGENMSGNGESFAYDAETGYLTLKIKSFSPFNVVYGPSFVTNETELAAAFKEGGNIVLKNNVSVASTLNVTKDADLDLNGYKLSGECNTSSGSLIAVKNGATLDIRDTSAAKTGMITYAKGSSDTGWAIFLEGALNLYSGTIELTGEEWSIGYCVDVRPNAWGTRYNEGTVFHMYGGKLISSDGAVRVAVNSSDDYKDSSSSFIMDGGEINAAWDGIFVQQLNEMYDTLNVTINNGTITSGLSPIRVYGPEAKSVNAGTEKPMSIIINGGKLSVNGAIDESRTWHTPGKIMLGGGLTVDLLNRYATITIA